MDKKIVDLEKLSDRQLLEELTERILAYEASALALHTWELTHEYAPEEEFCEEHEELKMDHDEDFCRVREVVRFVKKDNTIWEC